MTKMNATRKMIVEQELGGGTEIYFEHEFDYGNPGTRAMFRAGKLISGSVPSGDPKSAYELGTGPVSESEIDGLIGIKKDEAQSIAGRILGRPRD